MNGEKRSLFARILATRGMPQVITATLGLAIIFFIFTMLSEDYNFIRFRNLRNLLRQMAPILIIGIAQSYVLITGNIDLSIGSLVGMSCMISATLMTKGVSPFLSSVVTLVSCLLVGLSNGVLVAKCKLPPFIATLGTMTIARGIAQIVNNNHNTDSIGEGGRAFRNLFYYGEFGGIYCGVWIAIVLWLIFNFILSATRTGRHIYAAGSNIEAARMSGVNINYTVTVAYLVSALCSCVAGFMACATGGIGTMDAGNTYELYAVAASVIGGVSTLGGQGLLLGTVVGAAIWSVLQNGLILAGAPVAIRNISVGVIVVISVLLDIIVRNGNWARKKKNA